MGGSICKNLFFFSGTGGFRGVTNPSAKRVQDCSLRSYHWGLLMIELAMIEFTPRLSSWLTLLTYFGSPKQVHQRQHQPEKLLFYNHFVVMEQFHDVFLEDTSQWLHLIVSHMNKILPCLYLYLYKELKVS